MPASISVMKDRALAALVGGALGDAIGMPTQLLSPGQIVACFGRVETFATNGSPSDVATIGKGLELVPVTHPNDLFAGEAATFRLVVDGQPAAGLEIEIVRGGTRYRNAQEEIKATTDAKGEFSVTWPEAGMYWLETATTDSKTSVPQAKQRRLSYVGTFEVLPQ